MLPTQAPVHTVEQIRLPVLQEIGWHPVEHHAAAEDDMHELEDDVGEADAEESSDYFVINERPRQQRYKKKRRPIYIDVDDYEDLEAEENEDDELDNDEQQQDSAAILSKQYDGHVRSIRTQTHQQQNHHHRRRQKRRRRNRRRQAPTLPKVTQRNLPAGDDGIEGDVFQYEDFDFDQDRSSTDEEYGGDSYDDSDYADDRNSSLLAAAAPAAVSETRERATPDGLIPKHRRVYSKWSRWTKCSPKCTTRRYK